MVLPPPSHTLPAPTTADDATAAHNDVVGGVDRGGRAVRTARDLEKAVLEELLRVAANIPARSGGVEHAVERLGGAAAPEVEVLLLVVGAWRISMLVLNDFLPASLDQTMSWVLSQAESTEKVRMAPPVLWPV